MTAGDICNRNVILTRPDATIVEAAAAMKKHHVGTLLVVPDGDAEHVPIGIITDRDITLALDRVVAWPHMKVADLMTVELVTAAERESMHEALEKMRSHGIRRLPVINVRGGLEGILTLDDVMELLSEELTDLVRLVAAEQKRERTLHPGVPVAH